jgi:hypothetical protein
LNAYGVWAYQDIRSFSIAKRRISIWTFTTVEGSVIGDREPKTGFHS